MQLPRLLFSLMMYVLKSCTMTTSFSVCACVVSWAKKGFDVSGLLVITDSRNHFLRSRYDISYLSLSLYIYILTIGTWETAISMNTIIVHKTSLKKTWKKYTSTSDIQLLPFVTRTNHPNRGHLSNPSKGHFNQTTPKFGSQPEEPRHHVFFKFSCGLYRSHCRLQVHQCSDVRCRRLKIPREFPHNGWGVRNFGGDWRGFRDYYLEPQGQPLKMDVWWFPTISYVKIGFIIQLIANHL